MRPGAQAGEDLGRQAPLRDAEQLPEVLAVSQRAEALAQQIGDEARRARVYMYLANYHYLKGEHETAVGYADRCVEIGRAQADRRGRRPPHAPAHALRRPRRPRWGGAPFEEGFATENVLASYVHAHWASNPAAAAGFVESCVRWLQMHG